LCVSIIERIYILPSLAARGGIRHNPGKKRREAIPYFDIHLER